MKKDCQKCKGTGWFQYSTTGTPHSQICDACCEHAGTPVLIDGKYWCAVGCGTEMPSPIPVSGGCCEKCRRNMGAGGGFNSACIKCPCHSSVPAPVIDNSSGISPIVANTPAPASKDWPVCPECQFELRPGSPQPHQSGCSHASTTDWREKFEQEFCEGFDKQREGYYIKEEVRGPEIIAFIEKTVASERAAALQEVVEKIEHERWSRHEMEPSDSRKEIPVAEVNELCLHSHNGALDDLLASLQDKKNI